MKLNKEEKDILINWGNSKEDLLQIENLKYKFTLIEDTKETKITMKKAKEELGDTLFLSGIERAAFHGTAFRSINDNKGIYIKSNLFN